VAPEIAIVREEGSYCMKDHINNINLAGKKRPAEALIRAFLVFAAGVSILTTIGIVFTLGKESVPFFREVSLVEFFTKRRWQPQIHDFGILPLFTATFMTSLVAMIIALPAGLASAVYLSEYAPDRVRSIIKPVLEVLAGIPSVVYGFFALQTVTPFLQNLFGSERVDMYNTLSAGLVMGILILPLISSMCEDALSSVPKALREGAYALGATKLEVSASIVIPAALSGISAAFIVGLSRAVGETMIVALAAGSGPALTLNPFRAAETMTGHIVRISGGDLSYDSIDYNSLFAIGLLLFFITLALNMLSRHLVKKYQEVYE